MELDVPQERVTIPRGGGNFTAQRTVYGHAHKFSAINFLILIPRPTNSSPRALLLYCSANATLHSEEFLC